MKAMPGLLSLLLGLPLPTWGPLRPPPYKGHATSLIVMKAVAKGINDGAGGILDIDRQFPERHVQRDTPRVLEQRANASLDICLK